MQKLINLSEAALLAIHALAEIAGAEESASNQKLAEKLGVSGNHLSKVLQHLQKKGIIKSHRGPKGGYSLAKPAEEISFIEIVESIDGEIPKSACIFRSSICRRKSCVFGDMTAEVTKIIIDTLSNTKLSDFRAKEDQNG